MRAWLPPPTGITAAVGQMTPVDQKTIGATTGKKRKSRKKRAKSSKPRASKVRASKPSLKSRALGKGSKARRFKKGSPEAKAYMAKLRKMRK